MVKAELNKLYYDVQNNAPVYDISLLPGELGATRQQREYPELPPPLGSTVFKPFLPYWFHYLLLRLPLLTRIIHHGFHFKNLHKIFAGTWIFVMNFGFYG